MNITELGRLYRDRVNSYVRYLWGGPKIVTRGNSYDTDELPGFVVEEDMALLGAVLYRIEGDECEVSVLLSLIQGVGVGTKLLDAVVTMAKKNKLKRVWLVTTNDDTQAIRFYQKYGFSLKAVHIGAIKTTRKLKRGLPVLGNDSIPILHEFEFEILLN